MIEALIVAALLGVAYPVAIYPALLFLLFTSLRPDREPWRAAPLRISEPPAGMNIRPATPGDHEAVWNIFRAVIAPGKGEGFADIFEGNAFNNGLLPIELAEGDWEEIAKAARLPGGAGLLARPTTRPSSLMAAGKVDV